MNEMIRVLVVDDSRLIRGILRTFLESDPEIAVVGEARNGEEALAQAAELRPQVITMDVRMPVMNGLATTEHLMAYQPTPILVISSSVNNPDVDVAFRMLAAGALDVVETPPLDSPQAQATYRTMLIRRVKLLANMRVVTHLRGRRSGRTGITPPAGTAVISGVPALPVALPTVPPPSVAAPHREAPFPLVVIGASAGGPRIVQYILKHLPASLPAALLLVQHIADGFTLGMTDWLASHAALAVQVATNGTPLQVGRVLVAADGYDIHVGDDWCVRLHRSNRAASTPRPSVDEAMQSAAQVFGAATIGVVLSGMGADGALGLRDIRQQGGLTLAQDEATCPIFGMPRAAIELGVVDQVLPPQGIATAIVQHVQKLSQKREPR